MARHVQTLADEAEWDRALRGPFAFTAAGQGGVLAAEDHWIFAGRADAGKREIESAEHDSDMLDVIFGRMIDDGAALQVRVRAALPQAGACYSLTPASISFTPDTAAAHAIHLM